MGSSYGRCIRSSPYPALTPPTAMMIRHAPSKCLKAALCQYHLGLLSFISLQHQPRVGGGRGRGSGGVAGDGDGDGDSAMRGERLREAALLADAEATAPLPTAGSGGGGARGSWEAGGELGRRRWI